MSATIPTSNSPRPALQPTPHHQSLDSDPIPQGSVGTVAHIVSANASEQQLRSPQPLSPYFTVITDTAESTTYHPSRVHYIFSDDEPDLLIDACLRALPYSASNLPAAASLSSLQEQPDTLSTTSSNSSSNSKARAKSGIKPTKDERILVLDINATGDRVMRARSLTPTWQILKTDVGKAPTWAGAEDVDGQQDGERGLMLRIEGTRLFSEEDEESDHEKPIGLGLAEAVGKGSGGDADFQALMEKFDRKMSVLRTVAESSHATSYGDADMALEQ